MKKNIQIKPDEYLQTGPLEIARFGDKIIYQSNFNENQFVDFQKELAGNFDDIVIQIDELVDKISVMVSTLPAEQILQRAWFEMAMQHIGLRSEIETNSENVLSVRMLDYLQSIIVSVSPNSALKSEVSESDWIELNNAVEKLFNLINYSYHICHTAKRKELNPDIDMDEEEFYFKAQMYWCNVRGERYHQFQAAHLSDLLLIHSSVIEENFGISSEQLISELMKIQDSLMYGMGNAIEDMQLFQKETMLCVKDRILQGEKIEKEEDVGELLRLVIHENNWDSRNEDICGRFMGLDLFDVAKVTNIPEKLLSSLSFSRGEDKEFFSEGEYRGWPLRIWPVFKKPFVKLNGRYYCFDLNSLFDNFYRVMQRVIFSHAPLYKPDWNEKQKNISEELPFKYLNKLISGSQEYRSVYYRSGVGKKGRMEWCEADGLVSYDDHLFVIEVKAGAFTYTSPANDLPAYVKSIKGLVLNPSQQAQRFVDYLFSAPSVSIFDENHKEIGVLSYSDYRKITILPVTLDSFTEIAAQIQHLKSVGIDMGKTPTWSISIDDLRVYSDVFNNPLIFLHFLEQRMNSFLSEVIQSDDELDHLGMYLKHNNYVSYANSLKDTPETRINFHGYRLDIDNYYADKLRNPKLASPLNQKMPMRLMEIIEVLSINQQKGRTRISSFLLDCAEECRKTIINNIDLVLVKQKETQHSLPLSLYGDVKLTVFCWQESCFPRNENFVLEHSRAAMLAVNDTTRLIIELFYSDELTLEKVEWSDISIDEIPSLELDRLNEIASNLKKSRIRKAGKLGRNDPCSCGSGKKYKKCCIDLNLS
ncbi:MULTISPECIES: SEC-C metal-binding domain-containing protein [Photobacterium]|uniref:SEC-C metal-binding domain-containing protein n=1 Tax=Photobacterium TaxID=657 RepID=UPI00071AEEBB|nr:MULTISPECIES: SEC-C metal-binding domain-containing protein [Photobacterium]OBU35439.1 hypothetical protein AYY24_02510 [Photobacterium phosphoreum]PSW36521.1 hypothetical protein CTM87_11355 [Photobacterium phosphoreum]